MAAHSTFGTIGLAHFESKGEWKHSRYVPKRPSSRLVMMACRLMARPGIHHDGPGDDDHR